MDTNDLSLIRESMRRRRLSLSLASRQASADAIAQRLLQYPQVSAATSIAAYLSVGHEIDLQPTIQALWQRGQVVYLPVLHPVRAGYLGFAHYAPDTPLRLNRFAIPEPAVEWRECLAPWELDVVLMPLVAFDAAGHRLGMGGGFYDRSFAFTPEAHFPYLIGCAYQWQQVPQLVAEPWDVAVHAVVGDGFNFSM